MLNVALGHANDPQFDRKEAVRLVRLALSIDDSDPDTLAWACITSAFMVGDSESEIEMADRAVALNPNSYLAWTNRGWVYRVAGVPEEAIRSFERAIRMSPVDPMLYQTLSGIDMPVLSLGGLTGQSSQERRPNVKTPPIRQLTAASHPLSPISDVTPRRVRRPPVSLRSIPPLQYLRGSLGAGNQTRSC